jgi:[acyl-carrier-protein] S-malonyltransferase
MLPAALALEERLAGVPVAAITGLEFYGVDTEPLASPEAIRAGLVKQLHTPVHWAATVRTLLSRGVTRLIECGPGKVLTSLNRRIDKNREIKMLALEDPKSLDEALAGSQ